MSFLLVALASVPMTGTDKVLERRRRGFWMRVARTVADVNQSVAAEAIGLKAGTSILAIEKGRRDVTATEMRILAELYGVPVSMFAVPAETDEDRVIECRAELARAAISLAHEDLGPGPAAAPADAVPPGAPPRRLRA